MPKLKRSTYGGGARRTRGFGVSRPFVALGRLLLIGLGIGATVFLGQRLHAFVFRSDYFVLREIAVTIVEDGPRTSYEEALDLRIRSRLRREGYDGSNMLRVRTSRVRDLVEELPRVRRAKVRKEYPDRLTIDVQQRRTVALILNDPLLALDREGVLIDEFNTRHNEAVSFPYVTGLDVGGARAGDRLDHESLTWIVQLILSLQEKAPDLFRKVSEVHCGRDRDLTLVLKGGTEIRLGAENPLGRMPKLEAFMRRMGEPEQFAYINLQFERQVPSMTKQEALRQRARRDLQAQEG